MKAYQQIIRRIQEVTKILILGPGEAKTELKSVKGKTNKSKMVGNLLAKKALEKNIKSVVFDRGGFRYHGRVKALADGAREGGLVF